jgi:bacillithiol system protein YtxJ
MNWSKLNHPSQLEEIKKISEQQPVLIFKHSTRCSISTTALSRLERSWKEEDMKELKLFYLDLISYRPISNTIAEIFGVFHQSPQILIIYKGHCVYNSSHFDIAYPDIKSQIESIERAV